MLHEAKDAGEINVDDCLPVFFRVIDGGRAADDAGVVDEDVDGSKVLDGLLNQALADICIAHVAGKGDGFCASLGDEFQCGVGSVAGTMDGDAGSGFGQRKGNARAEAAR
jgi:hypothetical protein